VQKVGSIDIRKQAIDAAVRHLYHKFMVEVLDKGVPAFDAFESLISPLYERTSKNMEDSKNSSPSANQQTKCTIPGSCAICFINLGCDNLKYKSDACLARLFRYYTHL
jgi:hypothetical protein